jgi:proteasome lid subunit RPN8/RPN11
VATEDRFRRYVIDPLELLHADDEARDRGLDLIGIYHSHPNHPAAPSEFDRSRATPWYSYVILSIVDRKPREIAAWRFDDSTKRFEPEELLRGRSKATTRRSSRVES